MLTWVMQIAEFVQTHSKQRLQDSKEAGQNPKGAVQILKGAEQKLLEGSLSVFPLGEPCPKHQNIAVANADFGSMIWQRLGAGRKASSNINLNS